MCRRCVSHHLSHPLRSFSSTILSHRRRCFHDHACSYIALNRESIFSIDAVTETLILSSGHQANDLRTAIPISMLGFGIQYMKSTHADEDRQNVNGIRTESNTSLSTTQRETIGVHNGSLQDDDGNCRARTGSACGAGVHSSLSLNRNDDHDSSREIVVITSLSLLLDFEYVLSLCCWLLNKSSLSVAGF